MGEPERVVNGTGAAVQASAVNGTQNATVPHMNGSQNVSTSEVFAKYTEERLKRLRADGTRQYINPTGSDKFKHFLEDPFVEAGLPIHHPVPNGGHTKAVIIGAGFGGILFAVKLLQAGFKVEDLVIVDPAGGFGGTWYYNRFPGGQCDVESYIYMPLLEEMDYIPTRKYASNEELRLYTEKIATKYGLHDRAMFQCAGKSMTWNEKAGTWELLITEQPKGGERKDFTIHANFVMFASGLLNNPKIPDIGLDHFKGHSFHTARWDYKITGGTAGDGKMTNLADKKVAYVGTGATAIQSIPELAKYAKELYVFQRTPSSVDTRGNHDTDLSTWKKEIATKPRWQRARNQNFDAFVAGIQPPPAKNLVDDGFSKLGTYYAKVGGPQQVTMENVVQFVRDLQVADIPRSERVRRRAEQIVKDAETAKALQAWYPSWCKRPCFHDEYLDVYNWPNVHLVDTKGKGIDGVTENGIEFGGKEYAVDLIIWATGFLSPLVGSAAGKANMEVTGRHGLILEEINDRLDFSTLHGIVGRDFPNLFLSGPFQGGGTPNVAYILDEMTAHVAYVVTEATRKVGGAPIIEPSAEAAEAWGKQLAKGAITFAAVRGCTPSYFNKEGENDLMPVEMHAKAARNSIWSDGFASFIQILEDWRARGDLEGLEITSAA